MTNLNQSGLFQAGDTAWVLTCAALVLFMTPGLALFYGGMVRVRNVLTMLMQNFFAMGLVTVLWVLAGYAFAFGRDDGWGIIGSPGAIGLRNLEVGPLPAMHVVVPGVAIPTLAFVAYQMMFAVITPALITGATADRLKFAGWAVLLGAWSIIVYAPVAHWLFSPSGWLAKLGAQDWAGGLVVHASAGAAALAVLVVVGNRKDWPTKLPSTSSIPLVVLGTGILWFGWFGFNAGDGLMANGIAAQALLNTATAGAAAMLAWLVVEKITDGYPTVMGGACGAVAGLATITPCAGYVSAMSGLGIGVVAGVVCSLALRLKVIFKFDDALDVIAVHFVGGILGTLLLGLVGSTAINDIGANGLFLGGGFGLLGKQALATVTVVVYSFVVTWIIAMIIQKTMGLRVDPGDEDNLDLTQQGSLAYSFEQLADEIRSHVGGK